MLELTALIIAAIACVLGAVAAVWARRASRRAAEAADTAEAAEGRLRARTGDVRRIRASDDEDIVTELRRAVRSLPQED